MLVDASAASDGHVQEKMATGDEVVKTDMHSRSVNAVEDVEGSDDGKVQTQENQITAAGGEFHFVLLIFGMVLVIVKIDI
jgi:hypothetical protein